MLFRSGEIDFTESFTRRIALLRGLDVSVMEEIARNLPITEGLERLMTILKRVGYKTAILSGGFTYFGNYLKQKYGFDYVYANELEVEEGRLTGRHVGEIVDGLKVIPYRRAFRYYCYRFSFGRERLRQKQEEKRRGRTRFCSCRI